MTDVRLLGVSSVSRLSYCAPDEPAGSGQRGRLVESLAGAEQATRFKTLWGEHVTALFNYARGLATNWRLLLPHVLAATDPARRLDPVAAEAGWLLQHAGEYLQLRGRTHAARALLDDARGFDPGAG